MPPSDKPARRRWLPLVPARPISCGELALQTAQFHHDPVFFTLDCGQDGAHGDLASDFLRRLKSKRHFVRSIDRGGSLEVAQEAWLFPSRRESNTTRIISGGIVGRSHAGAAARGAFLIPGDDPSAKRPISPRLSGSCLESAGCPKILKPTLKISRFNSIFSV